MVTPAPVTEVIPDAWVPAFNYTENLNLQQAAQNSSLCSYSSGHVGWGGCARVRLGVTEGGWVSAVSLGTPSWEKGALLRLEAGHLETLCLGQVPSVSLKIRGGYGY